MEKTYCFDMLLYLGKEYKVLAAHYTVNSLVAEVLNPVDEKVYKIEIKRKE